jgi:hypothetical protein
MSLIKKCDVKNHLSARHQRDIYLCPPGGRPSAPGLSRAEPEAVETIPSVFAEDFLSEHSSPGVSPAPTDQLTDSIKPQKTAAYKSAQT